MGWIRKPLVSWIRRDTHLEVRVELALFEVLRARSQRVHEVPPDGGIPLHLAGQDGLHVLEDAVKHVGDLLERAFEELEVACWVGEGGVGGVSGGGCEEVDWSEQCELWYMRRI